MYSIYDGTKLIKRTDSIYEARNLILGSTRCIRYSKKARAEYMQNNRDNLNMDLTVNSETVEKYRNWGLI